MIPVGFGVQKVAGAMIWATDIDEDKNTRKEGGSLFGGGQKIVEYRYFANFAVAFGEGPAGGVLRIWAGDRLIADLRAGAGAYANHPKYRFRIYLGTEDQEPDRLIRRTSRTARRRPTRRRRSRPGLHRVRGPAARRVRQPHPADHRGDRLERRGPGGGQRYRGAVGVELFDLIPRDRSVRGQFYFRKTSAPDSLARVRIPTMTEEVRVPESEISGGNAFGPQVVDPDGNIYGTIGVTQSAFIKIEWDTLQNAGQVSFSSETQLDIVSAYTLAGRIDFVLALGFLSAPARIFFADDLSVFWPGRTCPPARAAWSRGSASSASARPGSRGRRRSCSARRPRRSASSMCGSSCRSRSIRSPARRRP